jgi:hypothetical protein
MLRKGKGIEFVFKYKDFNLDVLTNEIVRLNLDLGIYFVVLYTEGLKVGGLKPFYIHCKSKSVFEESIYSLYSNIISALAYLNIGVDAEFKLVIYKNFL